MFFYRDILELSKVFPISKKLYINQSKIVTTFSLKYTHLMIENGEMIEEPHDGHYESFSNNIWAILQITLSEMSLFNTSKKKTLKLATNKVLELYSIYLTDKGKKNTIYS
jgi:hypothetical protein